MKGRLGCLASVRVVSWVGWYLVWPHRMWLVCKSGTVLVWDEGGGNSSNRVLSWVSGRGFSCGGRSWVSGTSTTGLLERDGGGGGGVRVGAVLLGGGWSLLRAKADVVSGRSGLVAGY